MRAQAFGDGESARFEDCEVAAVHEGRHVVHVVQNRDVVEFHGVEERLEAGGVFLILARQKRQNACPQRLRKKGSVWSIAARKRTYGWGKLAPAITNTTVLSMGRLNLLSSSSRL